MNVKHITLGAVMYSPNIGDGVIAECVSYALEQEGYARPEWLDIAGRKAFEAKPSSGLRPFLLDVLNTLPEPISHSAVKLILKSKLKELSDKWRTRLLHSEGLIIGGGQLLSDSNLNFPLKLAALVNSASVQLPIAISGIGVSTQWSDEGKQLFSRMFSDSVKFISVRDEQSASNLDKHLKGTGLLHTQIEVHPDPGLLSDELIGCDSALASHGADFIGVGITHPSVLKAHSSTRDEVSSNEVLDSYVRCVSFLVECGHRVSLFTNGAFEDEYYKGKVYSIVKEKFSGSELIVSERRPNKPIDLVKLISSYDFVISHRLHANIVAYSCGVPSVGISWDKKVDSFFKITGNAECILDQKGFQPEAINCLIGHYLNNRSYFNRSSELKSKARAGVVRSAAVL